MSRCSTAKIAISWTGNFVHVRGWKGEEGVPPQFLCFIPAKPPGAVGVKPKELQTLRKSFSWAHLAHHDGVVVETLHEEFDGTRGQDPVIPQEQGQEANAYVFKLPGPEKTPNI